MSVWSGFTQLKQTIADELQQGSGSKKPANDMISTIERHAEFLKSDPPNVDDLIANSDEEAKAAQEASLGNETHFQESKNVEVPESKVQIEKSKPSERNRPLEDTKTSDNVNEIDDRNENKNQPVKRRSVDKEPPAGNESFTEKEALIDDRSAEDSNARLEASTEPTRNPVQNTTIPQGERNTVTEKTGSNIVQGKYTNTAVNNTTHPKINSSLNKETNSNAGSISRNSPESESKPAESTPRPQDSVKETAATASPSELSPEIKAKLAKFDKYETLYPRLLKAYKDLKRRGDLVAIYEKVLSEYTPCTSVAEPQKLVDHIQGLKSKVSSHQTEISNITAEIHSQKVIVEDHRRELAQLRRENAKLNADLSTTQSSLSQIQANHKKALENAKLDSELSSRVELLESKVAVAEQAKEAAIKSLTTTKSQLDELNARLKENFADTEVLRDELHESERLSQQRFEELSAVKVQLRNRDKDERKNNDKSEVKLSSVLAEKDLLESEVEILNKRIIRESEQLQLQLKQLKARLRESEAHEEELRSQLLRESNRVDQIIAERKSDHKTSRRGSHDSNIYDGALANESQLKDAKQIVENATRANALLKQVNDDKSVLIGKLQHTQRALVTDLAQLRQENASLKKRNNSVSSISRLPQVSGTEVEKQQAYLKNVLLGFLQRKDQRKALMPVLKTLLDLKEDESELFFNALV